MKIKLLSTLFASIALFSLASEVKCQWLLKDTVEFQPRAGLPNFFHKIKNNRTTRVGFIGGSITAANGWRPKVVTWMKEEYSNTKVIEYNAAIGGTNSKYGVFRMEEQLLSKDDLDLIFIEFAVNDNPGTGSDVEKSIEGMIRKIWMKNPATDICFVYTLRNTSLPDIENGNMGLTASKHDSIAGYYNIPSIFWGTEWYKLIEAGTAVIFDKIVNQQTSMNASGQYVLTTDYVHPTDYGHQVYTDVLKRSFKAIERNPGACNHEIKPPLIEDNYVDAGMITSRSINNHGMEMVDKPGQNDYLDRFFDGDVNFLVSKGSDTYCEFNYTGEMIGLNLVIGPSTGRYIIEVDGKPHEFNAFDGYCSYWRRHYRFVELESGKHHVKIYPSPDQLSLAEKEGMLNNDQRKQDLRDHPHKYETNEIILSDIFILPAKSPLVR